MLAIRQFEDERKAWEQVREELEVQNRRLNSQKSEVERECFRLGEELDQLRGAKASSGSSSSPPVDAQDQIRMHHRHEKQLALMATIDGLRHDLSLEQTRSCMLEQRASEAQQTSRHATEELERLREASRREVLFAGLDRTMASTPHRSAQDGSSPRDRNELLEARFHLEKKHSEVIDLEDETLRLREQLNAEKQKVIELKRAANSRGAAWKEEMQTVAEELMAKQRLEEEVARLRLEQSSVHKELRLLADRETRERREVERLHRELQQVRVTGPTSASASEQMEEMQILSKTVGARLVAVEQELTQQVQKSSQLLELFLRHAHGPLSSVRRTCGRIATSGGAGEELRTRPVPPLFEVNIHDPRDTLAKIVNLLRFASDVLEAGEKLHGKSLQVAEDDGRQHWLTAALPRGNTALLGRTATPLVRA